MKIIRFISIVLGCAVLAFGKLSVVVAQTKPEGGRIDVKFDESDIPSFDLYSNENIGMEIREGKLFAPARSVTKAVYNNKSFTDFTATVDMTAAINLGRIDSGIIFAGNNFGNGIDELTAWCVNVERDLGTDNCCIKLHRFNQYWVGAVFESNPIRLSQDNVRLTITVHNGIVTVYLNETNVFSYHVGASSGKVGIRNFCAPIIFDNFSITSSNISLNKVELENKVKEVEAISRTGWTKESALRVDEALEEANKALNGNSQSFIDDALCQLNNAIDKVLTEWDEQSANELLKTANALLVNRDLYIVNTVASVELLIEKCENSLESKDSEEIAYWCEKLSRRLMLAVKYTSEVDL